MRQKMILLLILAMLVLPGWFLVQVAYAAGTTVVVNETSDLSDLNPGDAICDVDVGAGSQCSLRAAIEELNALGPGTTVHHIEFNISGTGPFTITPGLPLPGIAVPVMIDGETQPGASCPTNTTPANLMIVLDGLNAGPDANGLALDYGSDGSIVRGLVIGNFTTRGILLLSNNNKVRCNHIGLGADGYSPMGNTFQGVYLGGDANTIGGILSPAQRNVISGNGIFGVQVQSENNYVGNNFIGATADGMSALGNGGGIYVNGEGNVIGSASPRTRNVISGNNNSGITVNTGDNNVIQGNYIGVARDGMTPLPNASDGISLTLDAVANIVGGVAAGEANLIAHNGGSGVLLAANFLGTPVQNTIRGNSIYANNDLGIDLGFDGVDSNDPGDGDGGENERQNYPVLVAAPVTGMIDGTLAGQANSQYTIDIYRSDSCNPLGYGEGQEYLATELVTADGSGNVVFSVTLSGVSSGDIVTATATDANGNTSEFSACVTAS